MRQPCAQTAFEFAFIRATAAQTAAAVVDRVGVARVVDRLLEQPHADAHYHRAENLVARGLHVDHAPAVHHRKPAGHAQANDLGVVADFAKVRAEGMRRVFLLLFGLVRFRVAFETGEIVGDQNLLKTHAAVGD